MILIIEGPNGSGKSHMINRILSWQPDLFRHLPTDRKIGHKGGAKSDLEFDEMLIQLPDDAIYVLDRHCTSDWVYGRLHGATFADLLTASLRFERLVSSARIAYVQLEVFRPLLGRPYSNGRVTWTEEQYSQIVAVYDLLYAKLSGQPFEFFSKCSPRPNDQYLRQLMDMLMEVYAYDGA